MPDQFSELDQSDVVLRRSNGGVVAAIPQFGLVAQGDSVQAALDALELKKEAVRADLATFAGLKPDPTLQGGSHPIRWGAIKQFAIKAAIVFGLLIAAIMYFSIETKEIVDSALYRMEMNVQNIVNTRSFLPRLEQELDRAAQPDRELPPEKKQKLLSDIRIVVDRWRPFVTEATAIFAPKNPPPAETPPSGNRQ
jgi:hypothetical protein